MTVNFEESPKAISDYIIDLSPGTKSLIISIKDAYPQLTNQEVEQVGNIMLDEISRRVAEGQQMAFWSIDSDGEPILTLLGLEIADRNDPSKNLISSGKF